MLKKEEHIEAMKAFLAGTIPYSPSSKSSSASPSNSEFLADPAKTVSRNLTNQTINKLPADMRQEK